MSKQPIEPKPTQYGNYLFRSRLEARWAVFFDYCPTVLNWEYEPRTFHLANGWTYTPDFSLKMFLEVTRQGDGLRIATPKKLTKPITFYVEVKPEAASADYLKVLSRCSMEHKIHLFLFEGSFFETATIQSRLFPQYKDFYNAGLSIFKDAVLAAYTASHFRFDLK